MDKITGMMSPENIMGAAIGGKGYMGDWYRTTQAAINPTAQLAAANNYLARIAGPQIRNSLTAAGLGRSGSIGEAMANAGAEMALPITQQASQQQFALNQMLPQMAFQSMSMRPITAINQTT